MNRYWFIAFVVWSISLVYLGWHGHTWYDGYMANKTTVKNKEAVEKIDQTTAIKVHEEQQKTSQFNQNWSKESAKNNNCALSPAAIKLLNK